MSHGEEGDAVWKDRVTLERGTTIGRKEKRRRQGHVTCLWRLRVFARTARISGASKVEESLPFGFGRGQLYGT